MDGVIAGLTTALVQGGDPSSLPTARASLEKAGQGPQGDLRRGGQDGHPEHEGRVGRDRQGRGRTFVQDDFRRRRRALDAPCRKGQARTRDEEDAVGGREMAHSSATFARNSRRPFGAGRLGLRAGLRRGSGTERRDGPLRSPSARHRSRNASRPDPSQAVDAGGRFAVTGGDDRTVRIWSLADGKLLGTIWIPVGPEDIGGVYAVAISPDGSTIAAGGWTEKAWQSPRSIFSTANPETMIRRIHDDLPNVTFPHVLAGRPLPCRYARPGMVCGSSTGTMDWSEDRSATTSMETPVTAPRLRWTAAS